MVKWKDEKERMRTLYDKYAENALVVAGTHYGEMILNRIENSDSILLSVWRNFAKVLEFEIKEYELDQYVALWLTVNSVDEFIETVKEKAQ